MKLKALLMATALLLPIHSVFAETVDEYMAGLKKEADIGNTEAKKKLDLFETQLHELEAKVKTGDAKAKYDLAEFYSKYDGNRNEYNELMTQSANQGYVKAERYEFKVSLEYLQYALQRLQDQERADEAYKEVMKWADKLLAKKDSETAYLLGNAYWSGREGLQKNYYKAKEMYEKAMNYGSLYAIAKLANCYQQGLGVEKNIPKAISLYEKAGQKGDFRGYGSLADMYENGDGVPKDKTKAQEYKIKKDKAWKCEATPFSCQSSSK